MKARFARQRHQAAFDQILLVGRQVETGTLGGWGLRFGEETWRDDPAEGVAIPDPQRTEAVTFELGADDAFAIAQPAERGATGSVAVWNLAAAQLERDFTLPTRPDHVAVNAGGTRLLAATAKLVTLWNVADGMPVSRLGTQTEFVLPPTFSSDGGYVGCGRFNSPVTGNDFFVARFDSSGALDGTFNGTGYAVTPFTVVFMC